MNKQKIFNRIKNHLLKQKIQSLDKIGQCVYRTKVDGKILKCAIGCLIQKKFYSENIEQQSMFVLFESDPISKKNKSLKLKKALLLSLNLTKLSELDIKFLYDLQKIHDVDSPSSWKQNLKNFAKNYNLVWKNKV